MLHFMAVQASPSPVRTRGFAGDSAPGAPSPCFREWRAPLSRKDPPGKPLSKPLAQMAKGDERGTATSVDADVGDSFNAKMSDFEQSLASWKSRKAGVTLQSRSPSIQIGALAFPGELAGIGPHLSSSSSSPSAPIRVDGPAPTSSPSWSPKSAVEPLKNAAGPRQVSSPAFPTSGSVVTATQAEQLLENAAVSAPTSSPGMRSPLNDDNGQVCEAMHPSIEMAGPIPDALSKELGFESPKPKTGNSSSLRGSGSRGARQRVIDKTRFSSEPPRVENDISGEQGPTVLATQLQQRRHSLYAGNTSAQQMENILSRVKEWRSELEPKGGQANTRPSTPVQPDSMDLRDSSDLKCRKRLSSLVSLSTGSSSSEALEDVDQSDAAQPAILVDTGVQCAEASPTERTTSERDMMLFERDLARSSSKPSSHRPASAKESFDAMKDDISSVLLRPKTSRGQNDVQRPKFPETDASADVRRWRAEDVARAVDLFTTGAGSAGKRRRPMH